MLGLLYPSRFNDCIATIAKSTEKFSYILTIARVVEEGEEIDEDGTSYLFIQF